MPRFQGKTAESPFLGATFWKKGTKVEGTVHGKAFDTDNGPAITIRTKKPITINGKEYSTVSMGNLSGFHMALRDSGVPDGKLMDGDDVLIQCIGFSPSGKGNDQVLFEVSVERK